MDVDVVCEICVIVGCVLLLCSGHVHICLCGLSDMSIGEVMCLVVIIAFATSAVMKLLF